MAPQRRTEGRWKMGQVARRSTLIASWPGLHPAGLLTLPEVATSPTIKKHLSAAAPLSVSYGTGGVVSGDRAL